MEIKDDTCAGASLVERWIEDPDKVVVETKDVYHVGITGLIGAPELGDVGFNFEWYTSVNNAGNSNAAVIAWDGDWMYEVKVYSHVIA